MNEKDERGIKVFLHGFPRYMVECVSSEEINNDPTNPYKTSPNWTDDLDVERWKEKSEGTIMKTLKRFESESGRDIEQIVFHNFDLMKDFILQGNSHNRLPDLVLYGGFIHQYPDRESSLDFSQQIEFSNYLAERHHAGFRAILLTSPSEKDFVSYDLKKFNERSKVRVYTYDQFEDFDHKRFFDFVGDGFIEEPIFPGLEKEKNPCQCGN